jgi:protein-L-isoaspartate(D-aspartate) O-methyltransferase
MPLRMALASPVLAATTLSCAEPALQDDAALQRSRERMVVDQIQSRGVRDPRVLQAMRSVPRHLFVPRALVADAYADHPLPIGNEQTISQPYIVAFMTEALGLQGGEKVLEIGTGSAYQAAVLSGIVKSVFTIEIVEPLAAQAKERLARLGYANVHARAGDGYAGWPEEAPFDAIMVTAAAPRIPEPLKEQLKDGGRLVIPVGDVEQELIVLTKRGARFEERRVLPVRFVPMTGKVRK